MATEKITAAAVEAMQPGDVLWDNEVRGFGVRRRARDSVYLVKTRIAGKQRLLTIGRHGRGAWGAESARREAQRLIGLIRDGKDIAAERDAAKAALTLAALASRYLAEYADKRKKPRTREEDARLLKLHILPVLGDMKARDITRTEVQKLHAKMGNVPIAANRALALLSGMMTWAEKVGERPSGTNPCRHVERNKEKPRERLLTPVELARLGEALAFAEKDWTPERRATWLHICVAQADADGIDRNKRPMWIEARQPIRDHAEDWRAIAAFRLLILTGARLSEILTLQWDWIDSAAGVAHLPDSKTGAKNVYLPAGALAVLKGLPRFAGDAHVLPGDRQAPTFVGIQKPWQRVRALAGLSGVRIHDLRHAYASTAVSAGDSLFIVGKLLGHRQSRTTERYSHLGPDPARAVADRNGERLEAMMRGKTDAPTEKPNDLTARQLRAMLAGKSGAAVRLPVRRPS